jgi:hypothetical protein
MARELSVFSMPCQSQTREIPRLSDEMVRHLRPIRLAASRKYN